MISEKGFMTSKGKHCPLCGAEFKESDVIQLNLTPEEIENKRQILLDSIKSNSKKHSSSKTSSKTDVTQTTAALETRNLQNDALLGVISLLT